MPIDYRAFCNFDPPGLVKIWNESLCNRGAAFLQGATYLEQYVLSKQYFDRRGLILAVEDGKPVGFTHAGFGPAPGGDGLNHQRGVICVVCVLPSHRRRGIGTELLRRAEAYLRQEGASIVYFGGMKPLHPFYWGLYGGSELPGVLASEPEADAFLRKRGYEPVEHAIVLDRSLDVLPSLNDPRFLQLKRHYDLNVSPRPVGQSWYDEVILGPLEMLTFRMIDPKGGQAVASAKVWDMDLFGWRWHQPAAGIIDVEVDEPHRRRGLGKYLMMLVLRYLQDQFYTLAEVQTMATNEPALKLYRGLGFCQVDEGFVYRRMNDG